MGCRSRRPRREGNIEAGGEFVAPEPPERAFWVGRPIEIEDAGQGAPISAPILGYSLPSRRARCRAEMTIVPALGGDSRLPCPSPLLKISFEPGSISRLRGLWSEALSMFR